MRVERVLRTHGKLSRVERGAHPVSTGGLVRPEEHGVALRDRDGDAGDLHGLDGRPVALDHGERVVVDRERERDEGARVDDAQPVCLVAGPRACQIGGGAAGWGRGDSRF